MANRPTYKELKEQLKHQEELIAVLRQGKAINKSGKSQGIDPKGNNQASKSNTEQEDLTTREIRFSSALKNAPITVAAQDTNLHFLWAYNQRTVKPEEVSGKTDFDIFPKKDAEKLIKAATDIESSMQATINTLTKQAKKISKKQKETPKRVSEKLSNNASCTGLC